MPWLDHDAVVSVIDCERADYPRRSPFHPAAEFPEYRFGSGCLDRENYVYGAVRELLYELGFDRHHFGTPRWNPLGDLVRPGDNVVIKPNLVISEHELGEIGLLASVAHGSVIRPLVDYVAIANEKRGRITICDSPIKEVDFASITELNGLAGVVRFHQAKGTDVQLLDIRDLQVTRNEHGAMIAQQPLPGDPLGYTVVDLGRRSLLAEVAAHNTKFRSTAAVYENRMAETHTDSVNLYSIPNSILRANCLISVAKLKNHRKCGVTLSLKNMIGATNEKRWLPHHRVGTPDQGGDICPNDAPPARKLSEAIKDQFISNGWGRWGSRYLMPVLKLAYQRGMRWWTRASDTGRQSDFGQGDWWGNDTIWRTSLDLNMIIRYADAEGRLGDTPQRAYLSVIDGIVGGHREGPLHPSPKECGLVIGGTDPIAVDVVCTHVMGFDPDRITLLRESHRAPFALGTADPSRIDVRSNRARWTRWLEPDFAHLAFEPSAGWRGYIERGNGRSPNEDGVLEPHPPVPAGV